MLKLKIEVSGTFMSGKLGTYSTYSELRSQNYRGQKAGDDCFET